MAGCLICSAPGAGNLCAECVADLDNPLPFVSEQVLSAAARPAGGLLLDVWGRAHSLEQLTPIGRTPQARGIFPLHASVSRQHAEIRLVDTRWHVVDLASSNGTRVNDEDVSEATLSPGDRVTFGAVGFYFVLDDGQQRDNERHLGSRTLRLEDAPRAARTATPSEETHAGVAHFPMRLVEAPSGGGGFLEVLDKRLRLSDVQLELMRLLIDRMLGEPNAPMIVRGFVPSGQLIASLPWDSTAPDDTHLKQLVRRTRRALDTVRLGGIIESRRGFGYRLRVIPQTPTG